MLEPTRKKRLSPEQRAVIDRRYQQAHPEKMRARNVAYYAKNQEKMLARAAKYRDENYDAIRQRRLVADHAAKLRKYGLAIADYDRMLVEQGGVCAICKKRETVVSQSGLGTWLLSVDHDHVSGRVRGLLCSLCNKGLGCLQDGALLDSARNYLDRSAARLDVGAIRSA